MGTPSKLARKIANKAREKRLVDGEAAVKAKKKAREREALALANQLTPDGFSPAMRAKLQDASKRANDDPRAKAIVEKAALQQRVERLRREQGIGQVSPPLFAGEPCDHRGAPIITDPKLIPPSVGEAIVKQKEKRKP